MKARQTLRCALGFFLGAFLASTAAPAQTPPPLPAEAAKSEGVTAKGLPLSQRGGVFADAAGLTGGGVQISAIDLLAKIPILEHTFADAIVPFGFVSAGAFSMGNPMVGAHHVLRLSEQMWVTLGGAFGFPLVTGGGFQSLGAARAAWDFQEFLVTTVPFALRGGFETHQGIAEIRLQVEPVFGIAHKTSEDHFFAVQHAAEAQIGHAFGGGLRYQGVVFATKTLPDDHYQGAFELFARLYHDPLIVRLGLVIPVDKPLGKPFDNTWGMKAMMGWTLD